jgi:predicted transcriptional regulator
MATSLHISEALLKAIDRHARRMRISRNRFILRAVERELANETAWSPAFFEELARVEEDDAQAVAEMLAAIRTRRTRKGAPKL